MVGTAKIMWEGKLWGGNEQNIIGYDEYSSKRSDNKVVKWFFIGLTRQKNYISIFVNAVDKGQYVAELYKAKLGNVKIGKSSISFPSISNINKTVLKKMLEHAKKVHHGNHL